MPAFSPIIEALPSVIPFLAPEKIEAQRGRPFRARMGANELVLGASPRALEAIAREAKDGAYKYPDPDCSVIRAPLTAKLDVAPQRLAFGNGIDDLLHMSVRLFMAPGDVAVMSRGAYPTFSYHVNGFGGRVEYVPYVDDHEDVDLLLRRVRETGAKMAYFTNPDNPMGTVHGRETIQRLIDDCPPETVLLLDEAYDEFAPPGTSPSLSQDPANVIRLRTFSKAYGFAGMRLGYAITTARIAAAYDRFRNHFGICRVTQAGAAAALADDAYLAKVLAHVESGRARLTEIARENGLSPIPSATNFVTMDCGRDGAFARKVLNALIDQDIFVRMPGVPGLDRCIRASVSTPDEIEIFAAALPVALRVARESEA